MAKLWQLKKLSTGQILTDPAPLPENWGPIFGLHGFIDKLNDLSWLGDAYADQGWFQVGETDETQTPEQSSKADLEWDRAKKMLDESDWSMLSDVPLTREEKALWIEYRRALREVKLQSGFPNDIKWPAMPA